LIGAGPGEPGLITVRGMSLLARADVVLYDALAHPALLDACAGAEQRNVGKRYGEDSADQESIIQQMIELAEQEADDLRRQAAEELDGARVAAEAQPGEVLVTGTVKDLVAGSGLAFEQRGERELKGVPDTWQIYAVAEE